MMGSIGRLQRGDVKGNDLTAVREKDLTAELLQRWHGAGMDLSAQQWNVLAMMDLSA
jgi:hypothetical protein